ncbi:hypothetical protein KSP39_PZI000885 [Platanthera zijinensis]|uniref:beta-carotene 3-hydroxylase n=1 Tax=Platanthera zijinensis TaxID=2320716 RepID=A0AAP0C2A0_9ASPA
MTITARRKCKSSVCFVLREGDAAESPADAENGEALGEERMGYMDDRGVTAPNRAARVSARKKSERRTYLVAAMMSSFGFTSMASAAVYYKFAWQIQGNEVPLGEMIGTFAVAVGAAVGMEYWARWAHRALWHASLWHWHVSHHRPRDGPFELNDIFAIINSIPAIALSSFGFFNRGLVPDLSFGAGLGITLYGMAYMFIHDGLVHRRIPVGPIAKVPFFQRVAAAHQVQLFGYFPYLI